MVIFLGAGRFEGLLDRSFIADKRRPLLWRRGDRAAAKVLIV